MKLEFCTKKIIQLAEQMSTEIETLRNSDELLNLRGVSGLLRF